MRTLRCIMYVWPVCAPEAGHISRVGEPMPPLRGGVFASHTACELDAHPRDMLRPQAPSLAWLQSVGESTHCTA